MTTKNKVKMRKQSVNQLSKKPDSKLKESEKKRRRRYLEKKYILNACTDIVDSNEMLQKEITDYIKGDFVRNTQEKFLLEEMYKQAQINAENTNQLKKKLGYSTQMRRPIKQPKRKRRVSKSKKKNWVETVFFYFLLLFLVLVVSLAFSGRNVSGVPRNIVGYAPMTILTKSMQRVYPQHSLVISKVTDPNILTIGDDITYLKENNTTVTHRIVGINEKYKDTGKRGFETKGVENPRKDEEVIRSENVIGKVVFSSLIIGKILFFIQENMVITAVTVIVFVYFIDALIKYSRFQFNKK